MTNSIQVKNSAIHHHKIDNIGRGIMELEILTLEYQLHGLNRAKEQWNARWDSLKELILSLEIHDSYENIILQSIKNNQSAAKNIFQQIVAIRKKVDPKNPLGSSQELEYLKRLNGQVIKNLNSMSSHSQVLANLSHISNETNHSEFVDRLLGLLVALVVFVGGTFYLAIRSIIKPLNLLKKSASTIGGGDFDVQIETGTKDEFHELGQTFNKMAESLKKNQEELISYKNNLEELVESRTRELEIAKNQAESADKIKSLFIASMSHELRTPLNSIIGFTGIILEEKTGKLEPRQRDFLDRVHQSGKHLLTLINDVLDLSQIESGQTEAILESFNLDEIVAEAIDFVEVQVLKNKEIELEVEVPPNLEICSDRKRVLQCLLNFLSNAVKFTERGGISVSAKEVGDEVEIAVEDTGIGIAEADLPKLFRQFERLESSVKIKVGGTGLGLYLSKKLATEVLGGSVGVESRLGVGSKFFLKFPKNLKQHVPR